MTVVNMPGRNGRSRNSLATTRIDTRNCYMTDAEAMAREKAVMAFEQVEAEHNLPAVIWWALVALVGVGGFFAGILLGSQP